MTRVYLAILLALVTVCAIAGGIAWTQVNVSQPVVITGGLTVIGGVFLVLTAPARVGGDW